MTPTFDVSNPAGCQPWNHNLKRATGIAHSAGKSNIYSAPLYASNMMSEPLTAHIDRFIYRLHSSSSLQRYRSLAKVSSWRSRSPFSCITCLTGFQLRVHLLVIKLIFTEDVSTKLGSIFHCPMLVNLDLDKLQLQRDFVRKRVTTSLAPQHPIREGELYSSFTCEHRGQLQHQPLES